MLLLQQAQTRCLPTQNVDLLTVGSTATYVGGRGFGSGMVVLTLCPPVRTCSRMSASAKRRGVDLVNLGLAMYAGPPVENVEEGIVSLPVTIDEPMVWESAVVVAAAAGIKLLQEHFFQYMHNDWISADSLGNVVESLVAAALKSASKPVRTMARLVKACRERPGATADPLPSWYVCGPVVCDSCRLSHPCTYSFRPPQPSAT